VPQYHTETLIACDTTACYTATATVISEGPVVMLRLPYTISVLKNAPLLFGETTSEFDGRVCDAVLETLINDAGTIPDCSSVCLVTGGARDYNFQTVLVQLRHGIFVTQAWDSLGGLNTLLAPVTFALDIPEELQTIRHDGTILRGTGNRNVDRKTGLENRMSTIYLVAGTDAEWAYYPRPLLHGLHPNTAANRIYRVMLHLEDKLTLI
jgi:hypothetical protein